MKKMIQFLLILMVTAALTSGSLLFSQTESKPKSNVSFFSPRSLYFYVMGSYHHFVPPGDFYLELGDESSEAFAPVIGIGYRVLNARDRFFLNVEVDYSPAEFDFDGFAREQKISVLTVMFSAEGTISSRPHFLVFGGIGVGFYRLSDLGYYNYIGDYIFVGNEGITTLALGLGIKVRISRNFTFRSEFRWNGEVYVSYDEYYDEWDNTDWFFLSSSFSLGLEFHF
ncbi:MAG: hypothetical protein GTO45_26680 [Candidatus Aminicenantes bacterium]|nr:hypothetical protein [Candidatus Aminicenantes bacterium]NIM82331.1 hypothetical protein [Candidatus Aminicenantes bacterium]NIN21714.1 hypothetical protein [Candidatus Aminicenantes bacterium]NIN45523.1 hypothetical protein [Candidatus Aminicenantes bacterium]NIN88354.1 hypothetical protein [Candidatus Aminicenantes bacterium]